MVVAYCINIYKTSTVGIIKVARNGKSKTKLAIANTVGTIVQHFLAVVISKRLFRILLLPLASYQFSGVAHSCRHQSIEVLHLFRSLLYMSFHCRNRASFQRYLVFIIQCYAINRVDNNVQGGQVKRQGRVAQQRIL